ncbi:MAG: acyl-CoA thioesterase [Bdellovibrionales bacterium]|nr:acyl-CoA thioesterase [Bdellovibrionales bacterium]
MFRYKLLIRESHLDTFGHVNNATYLALMEEARWEWITSNGYSLDTIQETSQGPTILEITIAFKRELLLRQEVEITCEVESYEGKIGKVKQLILNSDGQICCEATFTVALFDLQKRKLIEPTERWLEATRS